MISLVHLVMSLLLVFMAGWLLFIIVRYYYYLVHTPHKIIFVAFETAGDQKNKDAPQALSAKLRQLQLYAMQPPSGYGFLQMPMLSTLPKEAEKKTRDAFGDLSKLSLKIKDVDVNQLIQILGNLYAPPHYELSGRIIDLADAIEISCEMTLEGTPIRSWQSRTKYRADNAAAVDGLPLTKAGATDKNLDDILFQMIYDFLTQKEFEGWGISMKGQHPPANWQTLQAYTRGVQSLRAYQQSLEYGDLKDALKHLERVPVVAPDNAEGLYYYGLALSEDRQEAEAVAEFERLQRLLNLELDERAPSGEKMSDEAKLNIQKMLLETRLNTETARLKLYRLEDALTAKDHLDTLIEDLTTRIGSGTSGIEELYYKKLRVLSYAQLAYTHGTILAISGQEKLTGPADAPDVRNRIIGENIKRADDEFAAIQEEEKWNSDREEKDVSFRIRNAEGYSKFRYAQHQFREKQINHQAFAEECNNAISILERANRARPNDYEVLQNMAMIYEDQDFEASDRYLETAEALYERTKRFVPNDYYQYERLGIIQWRRAQTAGVVASAKAIIQKGKDYSLKAVEFRPQAARSLFNVARFSAMLWKIARAQNTSDASSATDAMGYFRRALEARPNNSEFVKDYKAFMKELSEAQPDDPAIAFDYGSLLLELAKAGKIDTLNEAIRLLTRAKTGAAKDPPKQELLEKATTALDEATKLLPPAQTP